MPTCLTFMSDLQTRQATAARALEFAILTAARTGEVIGAIWPEIDLDRSKIWTIPAARMNRQQEEHRVPRQDRAVALSCRLCRGKTTTAFSSLLARGKGWAGLGRVKALNMLKSE